MDYKTQEEEMKCCKCDETLSVMDGSEFTFDGKYESYCYKCKEEYLSEYCVSLKDYKEWWDKDYDEEYKDEFMYLYVKVFKSPRDAEWQYSIMWDGDESGKITEINTSSPFALMSCNTWKKDKLLKLCYSF